MPNAFFSPFGGTTNPSGSSSGGISSSTFSDLGTGVSDIFAGLGDQYKAEGERFEQSSYEQAAAPNRMRSLPQHRRRSNKGRLIANCIRAWVEHRPRLRVPAWRKAGVHSISCARALAKARPPKP
jgi:hypothetical protein